MISCQRLTVILDLDHFLTWLIRTPIGDFGHFSDGDFGLQVISDGDFGQCAVNPGAQTTLFYVTLHIIILFFFRLAPGQLNVLLLVLLLDL